MSIYARMDDCGIDEWRRIERRCAVTFVRNQILIERKESLARDMMNLAGVALELGFPVVAEDIRAAARRIKEALPLENFKRPEDKWRWNK